MKRINTTQILCLFATIICFLIVSSNTPSTYAEQPLLNPTHSLFAASNDIDYRIHAYNNIYFWAPCTPSNSSGNYSSGICGQTLTATDVKARLREAVEKFGGFSIDMQIEYGIPWETIFMHMFQEAQMGLAGSGSVAAAVEQCGHVNIMGYVYGSKSLYGLSEEQMGDCKPIHGDNKALAAQFTSYEDMIASFYVDYLRNGYYDAAFDYLSPNNYNIEKFLETETNIYSTAGWDGRVAGYGKYRDAWEAVKGTIYDVAKEKGWPTSAELAKKKNIPIGGKHPVHGDIKNELGIAPHSLSSCDGSSSPDNPKPSDDNSNSPSKSSDDSNSPDKSNDDTDGKSRSNISSYRIDSSTSATDFWFWEDNWSKYKTVIRTANDAVSQNTQFDDDFGQMPYIYAENYDINYNTWPVRMTPNGGKSTTKYYWISLPDRAFATHMGDTYVAYFENLKEPVHFIVYDVWACGDQANSNTNYCGEAQSNPNKVMFGAHTIGSLSNGGYEADIALAQKIGKLTCLHRLTDVDKTLVPESVKCNGATCNTNEQDYPQYFQQTDHTCGPTSMAMLATVAAGKEVSESDVVNTVGGDRLYVNTVGSGMVGLDKLVGDKYGFNVEQVSVNEGDRASIISTMREYLKKGYMIHISGCGGAPFTDGCHYVGIYNIDNDDNVLVADSSSRGNATYKLSDVINAGYHGDAFSAIQGGGNVQCGDEDTECPSSSNSDNNNNLSGCSAKVLNSIDNIIKLAKNNGYNYVYGGGHSDTNYFDSILKNNAEVGVDCTGFASLVMYAAFGAQTPFSSSSISSNSDYDEIPKSDVKPGDIFAYNTGCTAHGGIVAEVKNGIITKIAQTGAVGGGYSLLDGATNSRGKALGYFENPDGVTSNLECVNGKATDLKFYRYKGCR